MNRSCFIAEPAARRLPVASLLLVVFAVAVNVVPGVADWLQFDRHAVAGGELWRLVTSHFVHWSGDHLFWDTLAFGMLGWLCERDGVRPVLRCVALSAVLIPLTLWFAVPQMATYRGLSGIDSALFALLAVRVGRQSLTERDWLKLSVAGIVAGGFAAKVGFEFVTGATLFVDSAAVGMTPVPLAHVVGGLVGIACGLWDCRSTTPRLPTQFRSCCSQRDKPSVLVGHLPCACHFNPARWRTESTPRKSKRQSGNRIVSSSAGP
jgi:rhomboid family GlyGly-CTERM serine protease